MPALDVMPRSIVHIPAQITKPEIARQDRRFPVRFLRASFGDADVIAPPQ